MTRHPLCLVEIVEAHEVHVVDVLEAGKSLAQPLQAIVVLHHPAQGRCMGMCMGAMSDCGVH